MPLSIIKNVGTSISQEIIEKRKLAPYKDFIDFIKRNYGISINKKVLISLIKAGCFANLEYNENTLINNIDNIINYAELSKDAGMIDITPPELVPYEDLTREEKIENQLTAFGFYISEHPVSTFRQQTDIETKNINLYYNKNISIVLLIDSIKEVTTKNNDIMAFVNASDEFSQISLTLFPKTYKQYNNINRKDIIKVYGRVERRFDKYQIIVNSLKILKTKEKKIP